MYYACDWRRINNTKLILVRFIVFIISHEGYGNLYTQMYLLKHSSSFVYPSGRMNLYADLTLGILPKSLRIQQKIVGLKILLGLNLCGRQNMMHGEDPEKKNTAMLNLTVVVLIRM